MPEAKHTPGPWGINQYRNHVGFSIYADGVGCIAERWWSGETKIPIDANARLIAAAPELLDCLQRYVLYHDGVAACESAGERTECLCTVCTDSRAIIAKAEGRDA